MKIDTTIQKAFQKAGFNARGKTKKNPRYPDYDIVNTDNICTFGTTVFIRKDKQALMIIFPTGEILHFKPENEIKNLSPDI